MADTRKDRRAPVSLKVRFKSATVDEFIEHYCKDVSRGGIFIKSSQPMSIGTLLKFQFQLKDESSLIRGVGRVVWTRSPEDAVADQPAGMGIKFIKMDNESRAMVDRIVDGHGFDAGAYDEGRATASETEAPSDFPPSGAGSDNFFPDVGPAELPPPEDRTAVRQAAQFLAAAFSEAATDAGATREAEQKAEEARQRTAQIEAARAVEAERKGRVQPPAAGGSLPSMIIDPSLGSTEGKPTVPAPSKTDSEPTPLPISQHPTVVGPSPLSATSIPPAPPVPGSEFPSDTPTANGLGSAPGLAATAEAPKRSPLLPMAILAGIIAVAAYVATREKPAEVEAPLAPTADNVAQPSEAPPSEPTPSPSAEVAALPASAEGQLAADAALGEQAAADAALAPAEPQTADAALAAASGPQVDVDIRPVPNEAEVLVGGVSKGTGAQVVALPAGVAVTVTARAPGHSELSREIKPRTGLLPVKLVLPSLPYVVRVVTTPPGARVSAGPAKRGTSPTDLVVGAPLHGDVGVIARLPGYESARVTLKAHDFAPTSENNLATLTLSLSPLPPAPAAPVAPPRPKPIAPKPKPEVEGTKPEGADAAPAPAAAPSPASGPAQDAPVERPIGKPPEVAPEKPTEPAPGERPVEKSTGKPGPVPENPFGN
jgi:uncharacterized protein (TIGR02266 family)